MFTYRVEYAVLSDVGFRREINQDAYATHLASTPEQLQHRGHVFLVADGMGGLSTGEMASKMTADLVPHVFLKKSDSSPGEALRAAIVEAGHSIHTRFQQNAGLQKMGTTCSAMTLSPEGLFVGHLGDSRVYRIRPGKIEQLTFDHSLAWEMERLVRLTGDTSIRNEPRNALTRSLGAQADPEVDLEGPYIVRPGDSYLLCSDGLWNVVPDAEIGVVAGSLPPAEACQLLVDLANLRGGPDNITVLIVRVLSVEQVEMPSEPVLPAFPKDREAWMGWSILTGLLVAGLGVVGAVGFFMTSRPIHGVVTLGVVIILLAVSLYLYFRFWFRRPSPDDAPTERKPSAPYRAAATKLDREYLAELASLEYRLQQVVADEGWTVDWNEHQIHLQQARQAVARHDHTAALSAYGRVLHLLAAGMQHLRRHQLRRAKRS